MSVEIIRTDGPNPPCAVDGEPLKVDRPVRLYIFDDFHEIGQEIKNGDLNLAVCPNDGFRGWLWPGTLVIDRKRALGVYVLFEMELAAGQRRLEPLLELARGRLEAAAFESLRNSIVWVHNYSHIYELLCEDSDLFRIEVENDNASRQRAGIADINERAERLLEDSLRIGGLALTSHEATPEFLKAILSAVERMLDRDDLPDQHFEALTALREMLKTQRIQSRLSTGPDVDADDPEGPAVDRDVFEGLTEEEIKKGFHADLPRELRSAIAELIAAAQGESRRAQPADYDPSVNVFIAALGKLFDNDPARLGKPRDGAVHPEPLDVLIERVALLAPDTVVNYGDETYSLAEAVRLGARGRDEFLCVAAGVACSRRPYDANQEFWTTLTLLMARLLEADFSNVVKRSLAFNLCAEFLGQVGQPILAAGAYGAAVLALAPRDMGYFRIPNALVRPYAIQWQRLGRLFQHLGSSEQAALCAGFAAKVFRLTGDLDGYIRSRLDAISCLKEVGSPQSRIEAASQLLGEIRGLHTDEHDEYVDSELECLSALADAQFSAWKGPPEVLALEMTYGLDSKAGEIEGDAEPNVPLLLFDDDTVTPGPETDDSSAPKPSSEPGTAFEDSPVAEDLPDEGLIFVTRITIGKQQPYVASANISGIDWCDTYREAAKIAATHNQKDRWLNIQMLVLERSKTFEQPDVTLYLYRLLQSRMEKLKFEDVPPEFTDALLMVLAPALSMATPGDRAQFFNSPEWEPTLERWSERLRAGEEQGEDEWSPISGRLLYGEVWGLFTGEVFEALERYADAKLSYMHSVALAERRLKSATDSRYFDHLSGVRVTGLYRAARASLRHFLESPSQEELVECLDTIERYKARSALKEPYKVSPTEPQTGFGKNHKVSGFRSTKLEDLPRMFPSFTGVMTFALLEETQLNRGFWFSAFVDSSTGEVLRPKVVEFDDIYKPHVETTEAFAEARSEMNSLSLQDATAKVSGRVHTINGALERLGDALFPPEIIAEIEDRNITRLVIVPETYLFDVPFPALRVHTRTGRKSLFQVNEEAGGLALSVAPNWSFYAEASSAIEPSFSLRRAMSHIVVTRPSWRADVAPIFGVGERVRAAIEGTQIQREALDLELDNSTHAAGKRVSDFLRMLRDSRMGVFFGHGEIDKERGSFLLADDGPIGEAEITAASKVGPFLCELLILCACSGVNSLAEAGRRRRDLAGAHLAMLRGGVRFIVGSVEPLFPVVAVHLLETFLGHLQDKRGFDHALRATYTALAQDETTANPLFWGHIVGFGDGFGANEKEVRNG